MDYILDRISNGWSSVVEEIHEYKDVDHFLESQEGTFLLLSEDGRFKETEGKNA